MTAVVVDASAIVAMLVDAGSAGEWVAAAIGDGPLTAPELVMFEAATILRRQQLAGRLERTEAVLGHQELLSLPIELWPYLPLADRAWQLRASLTAYDASYVALAERLACHLVTLDRRLARAPGPTCAILAPPAGQ